MFGGQYYCYAKIFGSTLVVQFASVDYAGSPEQREYTLLGGAGVLVVNWGGGGDIDVYFNGAKLVPTSTVNGAVTSCRGGEMHLSPNGDFASTWGGVIAHMEFPRKLPHRHAVELSKDFWYGRHSQIVIPVPTPAASTTSTFFIKRPWKAQPQVPVAINGAIPPPTIAFLPSVRADVAKGAQPTTSTTAWSYDTAGVACDFSPAQKYIAFDNEPVTASFTLLVVFKIASLSAICTLSNSSSSSGGPNAQQFRTRVDGSLDLTASSTAGVLQSAAGYLKANTVHAALVSWDNAAGSGFFALDGRIIYSASPGSRTWRTDAGVMFGAKLKTFTEEAVAHQQFLCVRWPTALLQADASKVTANPWQLFVPRRILAPFSSAASGLPTLSLATYAPGSITTTGFRPRVTAS
jgi:hypothetical protein